MDTIEKQIKRYMDTIVSTQRQLTEQYAPLKAKLSKQRFNKEEVEPETEQLFSAMDKMVDDFKNFIVGQHSEIKEARLDMHTIKDPERRDQPGRHRDSGVCSGGSYASRENSLIARPTDEAVQESAMEIHENYYNN